MFISFYSYLYDNECEMNRSFNGIKLILDGTEEQGSSVAADMWICMPTCDKSLYTLNYGHGSGRLGRPEACRVLAQPLHLRSRTQRRWGTSAIILIILVVH